jgi:hypothetical protein
LFFGLTALVAPPFAMSANAEESPARAARPSPPARADGGGAGITPGTRGGASSSRARYAIASSETRLFSRPDALADFYRTSATEHYALAVIAERGEWIEARTMTKLGSANVLCGVRSPWYPFELEPVDVRVFVRRSELVPVLVRPHDSTFDDGTRASLRPGIALDASDANGERGIRDWLKTRLGIPAPSVGVVYARVAPGRETASGRRELLPLVPSAAIRLGGRTPDIEWPVSIVAPVRRIDSTPSADGSVRVRLDTQCAEYVLRVRAASLAEDDGTDESRSLGFGVGTMVRGDLPRIAAGARLFRRDRAAVGFAREELTPAAIASDSPQGLACFRVGALPGLELCAESRSVRQPLDLGVGGIGALSELGGLGSVGRLDGGGAPRRPRVEFDIPAAQGYDQEALLRAARAARPSFERCYAGHGAYTLAFTHIDGQATASVGSSWRFETNLPNDDDQNTAARCIQAAGRALGIPSPGQGTAAHLRVRFRSGA